MGYFNKHRAAFASEVPEPAHRRSHRRPIDLAAREEVTLTDSDSRVEPEFEERVTLRGNDERVERESDQVEEETTAATARILDAFRLEVDKSAKAGQKATRKAQVAARVAKKKRRQSVANLRAVSLMPLKEA